MKPQLFSSLMLLLGTLLFVCTRAFTVVSRPKIKPLRSQKLLLQPQKAPEASIRSQRFLNPSNVTIGADSLGYHPAPSNSSDGFEIPVSFEDIEKDAWMQKRQLETHMMQIAATASSAAAPQLSTPLLAADPTKDPESKKEVWIARLLLLSAAALYGTNFSMVKILDDTVPVGIGATLRFGLAAMAMLPWLLGPTPGSKKESDQEAKDTRLPSAILGFEAGMWNSIAYLAQAIGLQTTDASKVRGRWDTENVSFSGESQSCSLSDLVVVCMILECLYMFPVGGRSAIVGLGHREEAFA